MIKYEIYLKIIRIQEQKKTILKKQAHKKVNMNIH